MAFFDKVGATISNFGNDVSNKTKSMIEVSNLNTQLKSCEESLRAYYREVGKAFYEQNKDHPSPEFADQFAHIKEAEEAIDHLEAAIRRAKGTKMCQHCGAEIAADTKFCPTCGKAVDDNAACNAQAEVVTGAKCPKCGAAIKVGASFCSSCGNKME